MAGEATRKLTRLGMLAALSVALAALIHFPLFAAAPYLEYDPADIPILLAAFLYGPAEGVLVTVAVSFVQGLTVSASGGPIGIAMHILATGCFCIVAGGLYRRAPSPRRMALALAAGALSMAAMMALCNLLLTPLYTGASVADIAALLVPVILPFNLLKAGINAAAAFLLYTALSRVLRKA